MSLIKGMMGQLSLEFPVRKKNISDLAIQLETSGKEIVDRLASAQSESDENQAKMRHIIGIERWGARRLRGFIGNNPPDEEYDDYCPESGYALNELIELFKEARSKTVYLAIQIEASFVSAALVNGKLSDEPIEGETIKVKKHSSVDNHEAISAVNHNEFGPLTPRGWLRYLEMHARMESKSIK